MENVSISPVIRSGIKIIENSIDGVVVRILDECMKRSIPTEKFPEGLPGVSVEISWEDLGERKVFLSSIFCESMHSTYGDEMAREFIFPLFNKKIIVSEDEQI